jgi:hypothetical protein
MSREILSKPGMRRAVGSRAAGFAFIRAIRGYARIVSALAITAAGR